ncbi:MAG: FAD-dependent monooxygenase, partial [Bacteroidota bacterium]
MKANPPASYDLIIIGLGPVGLFAANLFGKMGWSVLAIEQHEKRWPYPRAIAMDNEAFRALQRIDLLDPIQAQTASIGGLQFLHQDNRVFFETGFQIQGDFDKGPYMFYQPELESTLEEGTKRYPNVRLQWGCKLTSFEERKNETVLCNLTPSSGEKTHLSCKYLLGCDGANSTVRTLLGIQEQNLNYDGHILKIDARAKDLSKLSFDAGYAQKNCSTQRAWVRMRGKDDHVRWEFQFKDSEVEDANISEADGLQLIQETGEDISNLELIHCSFYRYRSLVQQSWREGRVLIAGDAAHLTPPYIGQGMCSGIRDIVNLSWKLEAIRKGQYASKLLETYDAERIPHMVHFIRVAIAV